MKNTNNGTNYTANMANLWEFLTFIVRDNRSDYEIMKEAGEVTGLTKARNRTAAKKAGKHPTIAHEQKIIAQKKGQKKEREQLNRPVKWVKEVRKKTHTRNWSDRPDYEQEERYKAAMEERSSLLL